MIPGAPAIPRPRTPNFQALYADLFADNAALVERIEELIAEVGAHTYMGQHLTAALRPGGTR